MMTATREKFHVIQPQVGEDHAADAAELREADEWIADAKLAEQGGQRVSEWTWENWPETPGQFEANIAALRERIGQPWFDDDPDGRIVQEWEVDQIEAGGPIQYQHGWCWAVKA